MHRVLVYTTDRCRYCDAAKTLLEKRGVVYSERNLGRDSAGRTELTEHTGMTTFPQVVIDNVPIGGYDDLVVADNAGRLRDLATSES